MIKILLAVITAILIFNPGNSFAREKSSVVSASIKTDARTEDNEYTSKVNLLKGYLESHNSPLAPFAKDFIDQAQKYNLDWRLVAAISGVESSYGKAIPFESNNAWGWGVYGDNVIRFSSWSEGIETISEGLRKKYMDKWGAESIAEIGRIYASSPHWANSVNIHLNMIQKYILKDTRNLLTLAI